ncbi:MAG: glycosyltransferase family 2 protein [Armatimonadetes bacterium]|nr:glycosyltransferase family 2 protein [Armatimonadota bacterium]
MPDFDLSITICSWNTRNDLRECLASLGKVRDEANFEVIVLDNASDDGSPDMVQHEYPWVHLMRRDENLGFGAGHNRAMREAGGALVMPLNSDTIVHEGAIRAIVKFMEEKPDVGVLGPKLLNPDGSLQYSCRRFPTPMAALFRNTPLGRLFPNNRFSRDYLMQDWLHDEPRDVDWVSAAAVCIRRAVYEKIGGFDERFFMYMEDVDLCFRVWKAGYRVTYFPGAVITHAIGRSTDIAANKMIRQFHHSMMLFYKKHHLPSMPLLLRPLAVGSAAVMLWLRRTVLIAKNRLDEWKRRTGRL